MKTSKSKTNNNGQIILALAAILAVSLSCNFPLLSGSGAGDQKLAESIQSSGLVFPEEITFTEGSVIIEYTVYPSDSPELMIEGWLSALLAAHEAESDVESYQLINSFEGEPYLEVYASKNDLKGFCDGELSAEEFLDRLEIINVQPPDSRAYGLLSPLGLVLDRIQMDGTTLVVLYWPAPAEDQAEMMTEWLEIFAVLSELGGEVSEIEIQALLVDGSKVLIVSDMDTIESYLVGDVTALEFMAGLEVEVEEMEAQ